VILTALQHEHLYELSIALARPTADSDALVELGLAERGKGKFGEWVRITAKGKAEVDSARMADRGARAASTVLRRSEKTTPRFMPAAVEAKALLPLSACTRTATTRVSAAAGAHTSPPSVKHALSHECAASQSGDVSTSRRPSHRKVSSGQAAMVDAIRVTRGKRVTYYPMSMSASIQNGEHCKTGNRFYRSFSVAASAEDQVVL
jgi:hypothetical protein